MTLLPTRLLPTPLLCLALLGGCAGANGNGSGGNGAAAYPRDDDAPTTATMPARTEQDASVAAVEGGGPTFSAATPEAIVRVTRTIFPAVVRLDVAQEIYFEGKRTLRRGLGSGVII